MEDEDRLTSTMKDDNRHCALCLQNKALTIHEPPPWNHLPLPFAANAMLYVDFIEVPAKASYKFILVLVDALALSHVERLRQGNNCAKSCGNTGSRTMAFPERS